MTSRRDRFKDEHGAGVTVGSSLTLLALEGASRVIGATVADLAGIAPLVGGATVRGDTWWCRTSETQVIAVIPTGDASLVRGRLDFQQAHRTGLRVRDLSCGHIALGIRGRRVGELLARLGVFGPDGDPRDVAPVHQHAVAHVETVWVLREDCDVVAIVPRREAARVWDAVHDAGRPLGLFDGRR